MTMYGVPSSAWPTSMTRPTCSLRSMAEARASRRNRSTASRLLSASGWRNLIATRWPSALCSAATT